MTTKAEVFNAINTGNAIHTGSVRIPNASTQLDKWKTKDNNEYLITSMNRLRGDRELHTNPEYKDERLQLLTLIN